MLTESKMAEERAKKAMIDAARLADELRIEQENAQYCEKTRKTLDYQVKDMQSKLDEAEQLAMKGGRKITSRNRTCQTGIAESRWLFVCHHGRNRPIDQTCTFQLRLINSYS